MERRFIKMMIFALVGLWAASAVGRDAGEEEMPVFMMSEKGETCIQVKAGETFALRFRTTPGTGYGWEFAAEPDKQLLQFLGEELEQSESGRIGGSVFAVWTFCALAAGEAEIHMKYVRPWEKEKPPEKEHVFKVKVQ